MKIRSHCNVACFSVCLFAAFAIFVGPAHGQQSENVSLLSHLDSYSTYSDIWGYDSGGTEIAIVGEYSGTWFVDATDPQNPATVGYFGGPESIWRDIKTYGSYAYISNETGSGLRIINLNDPLNPTDVGFYAGGFSTCHNIFIDTDTGYLYAVGTDNGTVVLDLTGNPESPSVIATWDDHYIHDIFVRDGLAYGGAVYDGLLIVLDVSSLPTITITDTQPTADVFTHNTWVTDDGNYCLTTDEVSGGHITVVDVSDPYNLSSVGEFTHPDDPSSIIHNVHIRGDFAFVAWYKTGLQVIDVSNPLNLERVGYYDTYPGTGSGFDGAWGAYPYSPSGAVYVSDISTGLYVLQFEANFGTLSGTVTYASTGLPVEGVDVTVPVAGKATSTNGAGYYQLTLEPGSHEVHFDAFAYDPHTENVNISAGGETTVDVALDPLAAGSLSGIVETLVDGDILEPLEDATVRVLITPLETQTDLFGQYEFGSVPTGSYDGEASLFGYMPEQMEVSIFENEIATVDFLLLPVYFADDLESDNGWTVGAAGDNASAGIWVRVDPNGTGNGQVQPEDDHTAAPGVNAFVTGNGPPGGSLGEADVDGGTTTLLSPIFNLNTLLQPKVSFYRWYSNDAGNNPGEDDFVIDVSEDGGSSWINLETLSQTRNFWEELSFNLEDYITDKSQVQFRFVASDLNGGSIVEAAIDDFQVFGEPIATDVPMDGVAVGLTHFMPAAPNPFGSATTLRFELASRGRAVLDIYDIQGRLVTHLVDGVLDAGLHAAPWDGRSTSGELVAPGLYMGRLQSDGQTRTLKLMVTR